MLCPAHKGWPDRVVGTWSGLGIRRIVVEIVVRNLDFTGSRSALEANMVSNKAHIPLKKREPTRMKSAHKKKMYIFH